MATRQMGAAVAALALLTTPVMAFLIGPPSHRAGAALAVQNRMSQRQPLQPRTLHAGTREQHTTDWGPVGLGHRRGRGCVRALMLCWCPREGGGGARCMLYECVRESSGKEPWQFLVLVCPMAFFERRSPLTAYCTCLHPSLPPISPSHLSFFSLVPAPHIPPTTPRDVAFFSHTHGHA